MGVDLSIFYEDFFITFAIAQSLQCLTSSPPRCRALHIPWRIRGRLSATSPGSSNPRLPILCISRSWKTPSLEFRAMTTLLQQVGGLCCRDLSGLQWGFTVRLLDIKSVLKRILIRGGFLFLSQFAYFPRVMSSGLFLVALALGAGAQELYITANGTSARPQCTAKVNSPSYFFQSFSYTLNETVRYAVGLR